MNFRTTAASGSRIALAIALAVPALIVPMSAAQAQGAEQGFNIPAGDLAQALQTFSAQTGIQLVFSSDLVAGKRSPGVSGRLSPQQALARLLAGSGLSARVSGNTATLLAAGAGDTVAPEAGERVLGAVRVEGSQDTTYFGGAGRNAGVNGINGSGDITATEGTGSFTSGAVTTGSKVPQALKDTPQSVSVLTSEVIQQKNITDLASAMNQLPGVTVVQGGNSVDTVFYSRGFEVSAIQIDGGAPLLFGSVNRVAANSGGRGSSYYPQIEMAQYDHVELLRGADGLLNGYGNPGGTVNLVRKKPLDHSQVMVEASLGSWNNYRLVIDATAPLALEGALRGRLITTYQDREFFYNTAKDNRATIYGTLQFDITPTTVLTAGLNYSRQDSLPWLGGLPRYQNGDDLGLPRSTSTAFPFNQWNFRTTEVFASLEKKIGKDWLLKLNLTNNDQQSLRRGGVTDRSVSTETNAGPIMFGTYDNYFSNQLSTEALLTGSFELFGQRQEVVIGANRVSANSDGLELRNAETLVNGAYVEIPVDVFNFDPNNPAFVDPVLSLPFTRYPVHKQIQSGAFIDLRLTMFDRLHLKTGIRWSQYKYRRQTDSLCIFTDIPEGCVGKAIGDVYLSDISAFSDKDFSWPPPVNLSFDATRNLTVYAGYTNIYQSQANLLDESRNPLKPITGGNYEAGLKWARAGGKLNASFAVYRINEKNFPFQVTFEEPVNDISCCYVQNPNNYSRSEGVDLDLTGELMKGLQVSASYTYNKNKRFAGVPEMEPEDAPAFPLTSIAPKHNYKLWINYDFGIAGHTGALSKLAVSLGINGKSAGYRSGQVCLIPLTPFRFCPRPSRQIYEFTIPSYAIVSGRVNYALSETWSLSANFENIFDKRYYTGTGGTSAGGNFYGDPRNVTVSLRAKW